MEIIVGNSNCQRTCSVFLTVVRPDSFNFCVEINLNFVLNIHKHFCIEFTCWCELQTALGTFSWRKSLIVESGDITKVQNTLMSCALIFSMWRRFFSAPSAHNLEFLADEKNLLLVDRRVVVEYTCNCDELPESSQWTPKQLPKSFQRAPKRPYIFLLC